MKKNKNNLVSRLRKIMLFIVGIVSLLMFTVVPFYAHLEWEQLKREGMETTGTIVDISKATRFPFKRSRVRKIRYDYKYKVNGQIYKYSYSSSFQREKDFIGAKLRILYLPKNPNVHRIIKD